MKPYYYVITFDGHIFEIEYSPESLKAAIEEWRKGGILVIKNKGGIHASSIAKILSADEYENWYQSTKPKEYILNGTWRDGKEHGVIRHEDWKEAQLKAKEDLKISAPVGRELSPEEVKERIAQIKEFTTKKFRVNK
jgi:hypothetical protein